MKPTVHILVRVRKPQLLAAALLVFRTIRTGFPTSPIQVWGNALAPRFEAVLLAACNQPGINFVNIAATSHDAWIESLILESYHPFWICDTDVVFWRSMEDWADQQPHRTFMGRYEPRFEEPYTDTVHVERLHTCVMSIDPAGTRAAMRQFMSRIPEDLRDSAQFPLVREYFLPSRASKTVFYDTMAGLWQAGAGTAFTEEQNDCFDHLNCGSYADLITPSLEGHLEGPPLVEQHAAVFANPELLRGARHAQAKFYEAHRVNKESRKTGKRKEASCHTHQG